MSHEFWTPEQKANRLWDAAGPIQDTLAAEYLEQQIGTTPRWDHEDIAKQLRHLDGDTMGKALHGPGYEPKVHGDYPPNIMVAAVRDSSGDITAVQLTELYAGGTGIEAILVEVVGSLGDGAVKFGSPEPGKRLGLDVSVEDALGSLLLCGYPQWAVLTSDRFTSISLPTGVSNVEIGANDDMNSLCSATVAAEKFKSQGIATDAYWRGMRVGEPRQEESTDDDDSPPF